MPENCELPSKIGPLGENLIYLIGLPRSGTTLLSQILNKHPDIVAPPEPWIMLALEQMGRVDQHHTANAWVLHSAVKEFAGEQGLTAASRAAARTLYNAHLSSTHKSYFLDKTPRYLFILDYLKAVFPRAKFLCLVRNPLDIAASYLTSFHVNLANVFDELIDTPYLFDMTIGLSRLDDYVSKTSDSTPVIRYEDMVRQPADTLTAVLKQLGMATEPETIAEMCRLEPRELKPGQFGDRKILSTMAPHCQSIDRYQTSFKPSELQSLLNVIGTERLLRLGYENAVFHLKQKGIRERPEFPRDQFDDRVNQLFQARLAPPRYISVPKPQRLHRLRKLARSIGVYPWRPQR